MLLYNQFQHIVLLNETGSADQFAYKLIEDNSSNMAQKMIYIPACVSFCMPLINLGINSIFSSIQQFQWWPPPANVASAPTATEEDLLRS